MKILHITYHSGLTLNLNFVAKSLGHEIETQFANWNYNIGHNRAEEIWNKYKDYYNQFDIVITSDTCPLSRIFLQNNFNSKLVIWVANRFDYADQSTNDCAFPDQEYYNLIRSVPSRKNVKMFSYTKFEWIYASKYKNVFWNKDVIKPCSFIEDSDIKESAFPPEINKKETFFIPPYHNDTLFMNLKDKCGALDIHSYAGRYNGPQDLHGIKGIIHIPYGWSQLAIFENLSIGNVYLIPSKEFLLKLSKQNNFWWQDSYALEGHIESSEWYLPEHKDLFIYFNDWNHLKELSINDELINNKKEKILRFSESHTETTLNQWKDVFHNWKP